MKIRFPKDDADWFLIIAVALTLMFIMLQCTGCVTKKEAYFIVLESNQVQVKPKTEKSTICESRFERQFQQADSTFMSKLRKASKEAREAANKQIYLK